MNRTDEILISLGTVSQATMGIEGGHMEGCTSLTHLDWRILALRPSRALVQSSNVRVEVSEAIGRPPLADLSGPMVMEKPSYYLSKDAFFCLADNHYVFLDLRSDEYLCLGRTHTDAMKGLLNGHHIVDECSADIGLQDSGDSDPGTVIQALLQKGLLVQDATDGKFPSPACVGAPSASVLVNSDTPRAGIQPSHVWKFFAASAAASWNLRWQSIERTVRKVEARKSTHTTDATAVDSSVLTDLFEIFQTLRPYYPRPYLCLFDSLALLHFLARFSIFPRWVFAVKLEPFGAHCWVQAGDLVVNDIIDNVRDYTPIMIV